PELQPGLARDRQRRHGPGERVPPAVFRADVLLHRLDVGLARALAGGHRQARRRLRRLAVRLRDLGRASHLLDLLQRLEAADRRLELKRNYRMAPDNDKPRIGDEIRKMEVEPLLPIEK